MARTDDRARILDILNDSPAGLSNQRIRTKLRMGRERYEEARAELLTAGEVEKYVCHGGGIRLTTKGEATASSRIQPAPSPRQVAGEAGLYPVLVEQLFREETDENVLIHHFTPASLRRAGKWKNPDVATIRVDVYPRIQRLEVVALTYEVKPHDRWDIRAVFEAERQGRFSHGAVLVLEWPENSTANIDDPSLAEVRSECEHHNVSLATLERDKRGRRLNWLSLAQYRAPAPAELEEWLDYTMRRMPDVAVKFDELMRKGRERLRKVTGS